MPCAQDAQYHTKKKTFGYRERNEAARKTYQKIIANYPLCDRVYVDEAGISDDESYAYGWAPQGKRCYASKKGHAKQRFNFIGALCQREFKAPMLFEGYCNRAVFSAYVNRCLVPTLQAGQVVILDNARFHHAVEIREAIEAAGCHLQFLPPYSPDLNPIEHCWFPIKHAVRHAMDKGECLEQALTSTLKQISEPLC